MPRRPAFVALAALLVLGGCASVQYSALGCRENFVFIINPELNRECGRLAEQKGQ